MIAAGIRRWMCVLCRRKEQRVGGRKRDSQPLCNIDVPQKYAIDRKLKFFRMAEKKGIECNDASSRSESSGFSFH